MPPVFTQQQLAQQLSAANTSDYYYFIDIFGGCNLHCPSCPTGNRSHAQQRRRMSFADFQKVLEKIRAQHPGEKIFIDLYNWGEPFLHPELPQIIRLTKEFGYGVGLSSNLNHDNHLYEAIAANPDYLRVSLSGSRNGTYQLTHCGGDIEKVLGNLQRLRRILDETGARTVVQVGFHVYKTNFAGDFDEIRELCLASGFLFAPVLASIMPAEEASRLVRNAKTHPNTPKVNELLALPLQEQLRLIRPASTEPRPCEFKQRRTAINSDLSVSLCCATYEENTIIADNFLTTSRDQLAALKVAHPFCKECQECGLDLLYTGTGASILDAAATTLLGKQIHYPEPTPPVAPPAPVSTQLLIKFGNQVSTIANINELMELANRLAAMPHDAAFFSGLFNALTGNWYLAAESLFSWLSNPGKLLDVRLEKPTPSSHQILMILEGHPTSSQQKISLLREFVANRTSKQLIEASALTLSKFYGSSKQFDLALEILEKAIKDGCSTTPLNSALHVIKVASGGFEIPPHWERFIGPDNTYLHEHVCRNPFERFDITWDGGALLCCGHWLPEKIGNILEQPCDKILNSPMAQAIRKSVTDGSYLYCDHIKCSSMKSNGLIPRGETSDRAIINAMNGTSFSVESPKTILYGLDKSCNLSCPSCRNEVFVERKETQERYIELIDASLLDLLHGAESLNISVSGELFASKSARSLLKQLNKQDFPRLRLDIISNGTLFDEKAWSTFPGIHDMIRDVRISIDAATKETFEKLRRGGNFEILCRNLSFLASLKATGNFEKLLFSFTYQLENHLEMGDFVRFAKHYGCDRVLFERLQKIAQTEEEFKQQAVHLTESPYFQLFLDQIRHPIMQDEIVVGDFDYTF